MNKIQEHVTFLQDILINPVHITGWVNANLYLPSNEVFGILPIPQQIRTETAMTEYIPSLDKKQRHRFLAEMQEVHKPVLPVHNSLEKELFRHLMETNTEFNSPSGPIWKKAVKVWNHYTNTNNNIFYKVCYRS